MQQRVPVYYLQRHIYPWLVSCHPNYPTSLDSADPDRCCSNRMSSAIGCAQCCAVHWPTYQTVFLHDLVDLDRQLSEELGNTVVFLRGLSPTAKILSICYLFIHMSLPDNNDKSKNMFYTIRINSKTRILQRTWWNPSSPDHSSANFSDSFGTYCISLRSPYPIYRNLILANHFIEFHFYQAQK